MDDYSREDYRKDYLDALERRRGYAWICQKGDVFMRDELIDIIKELDYAIHCKDKSVYDIALENLKERWEISE